MKTVIRRGVCGFVALCSLAVLAADPPENPAVQKEIERLQGEWKSTLFEVDGVQKPPEEYEKYKVFFEGNLWTAYEDGKIAAQSTYQPDPSKKPKTIDIHLRMEDGKTRLIRGIYKLRRGTLTICDRAQEKGERPTRFASAPDTGLVLVRMKRVER